MRACGSYAALGAYFKKRVQDALKNNPIVPNAEDISVLYHQILSKGETV